MLERMEVVIVLHDEGGDGCDNGVGDDHDGDADGLMIIVLVAVILAVNTTNIEKGHDDDQCL